MAQLITVRLNRGDATPWGFRLQGGKDFGTPLVLQKVNGSSIADMAGLVAGDAVLRVNGTEVFNLRHKEAQDVVVRAGNNFEMTVQRGGSTWKPSVQPTGHLPQPNTGYSGPVTRTSLAANNQPVSQPIGGAYNNTAKSFMNGGGPAAGADPGVKSIVNKQYNTPVGMYSDETIAETLSAQAEVLAGGVLGVNFKKNEKMYNSANSEVYKMLQEAENEPPEPEEPRTFSPNPVCTAPNVVGPTKHVTAPINQQPVNRANTGGLPTGQNICAECERLIVGVFVRIKDKNLHVDCFKCATCGSSLKNQGYFNINGKLYCDVHAKLIAMKNPPPGTEGYVPVPIKPTSKLSANTISQALNAHHNISVNGNPGLITSSAPVSNLTVSSSVMSPSHSRTNSTASVTTSPSTSAKSSPIQSHFTSPTHSRESSLSTGGSPISPHDQIVEKNLRNYSDSQHRVDSKLLQLEKDCFENGDKENTFDSKDTSHSIYGSILPINNEDSKMVDDMFMYKTMDGQVIRSVLAPGSGRNVNYKLNANIGGPKPYSFGSAAPMSPPVAAPKSPSTYPPPSGAPAWTQPKTYASATLPRSSHASHNTPGNYNTLRPFKSGLTNNANKSFKKDSLDEISSELHQQPGFVWPPKDPDADPTQTPTATPLYVPPPETQHVKANPVPPQEHKGKASLSAPELRSIVSDTIPEVQEIESSSESCTSTTNTTSDEYSHMRIYQPGPYAIYDQGFSDSSEYNEHQTVTSNSSVAQTQHKQSICSTEVTSICQSAEEHCRAQDYLADTIDTKCLVENIRALTPRPTTPPPMTKHSKHVEFIGLSDKDQGVIIEEVQESQEINENQMTSESTNVVISEESSKEVQFESKAQSIATHSVEIQSIPEVKILPPSHIQNAVPHQWESAMVKALKTAPDTPYHIISEEHQSEQVQSSEISESFEHRSEMSNVIYEEAAHGSLMSSVLTTAPSAPLDFSPKFPVEPIPLPEETAPYFPPAINMKAPRNDDISGSKSPMLSALITAPDRPYSPFGGEVIYQLDDLPTPTEKMTMQSALTVASDRPYTPMTFDSNGLLISNSSMTTEMSSEKCEKVSAFASVTNGNGSSTAFQPVSEAICTNQSTCQGQTYLCSSAVQSCQSYQQESRVEQRQSNSFYSSSNQMTEQSTKEGQSELNETRTISFPPPNPFQKPARYAGLHRPDAIPNYQHNIKQLPSQQSTRPPVSPQLKENVPLAFVDGPDHNHEEYHDVAVHETHCNISHSQQKTSEQVQTNASYTNSNSQKGSHSKNEFGRQDYSQFTQISVPVLPPRSGPITMTFQSLDAVETEAQHHQHLEQRHEVHHQFQEQMQQSSVQHSEEEHRYNAVPRPYTPSLINKPAPIIPHYQQNLAVEEFGAPVADIFDPRKRSPSPCPISRAKSPAPGPPPNPLKIQAPRLRESVEFHNVSKKDDQNWASMHGMAQSSFLQKPEAIETQQIGNLTVQKKTNESQANQAKKLEAQSQSVQQIGNTQIQRCTKVVEEFERSQTSKTIEIARGEKKIVEDEMPPRGIVANQARRFSQDTSTQSSVASKVSSLNTKTDSTFFPSTYIQNQPNSFPLQCDPSQQSGVVFPPPGFPSAANTTMGLNSKTSTTANSSKAMQFSALASATSDLTSITTPSITQFKPKHDSSANVSSSNTFKQPVYPPTSSNLSKPQSAPINSSSFAVPPPFPTSSAAAAAPPLAKAAAANASVNLSNAGVVNDSIKSNQSSSMVENNKGGANITLAPKRGRGVLNKAVGPGGRIPLCGCCSQQIRGPFITALGRIWCPDHFVCVNGDCRRPLADIGFVEEKGDLYCEYCFERFIAPSCCKCNSKIKGDCLNAIGKHFHPECFTCAYCGKLFGNSPFFLEDGSPYCEADWNEMFTTKCFACGFPVEAGDRWVEALGNNYHSQCFNCTACKKNLEGQSFFAKSGRPFCKAHAR